MKRMAMLFLDILYPRRCPLCHGILTSANRTICPDCEKLAVPIGQPRCFQCGRPVEEEEEYCRDCRREPHVYDRGRGIFAYNDRWRASVVRFKYYGCREYGDFYGDAMRICAARELAAWKPDLLVPVPLHKSKRRARGFNQAEYLARRVSAGTGIPMDADLVCKRRRTRSQKQLDRRQRQKNLSEAFAVAGRVDGKRILVIDDVYTTGSTMDAMADCLKKSGASRVYFLTAFIA